MESFLMILDDWNLVNPSFIRVYPNLTKREKAEMNRRIRKEKEEHKQLLEAKKKKRQNFRS
jgi:hypothetical protein